MTGFFQVGNLEKCNCITSHCAPTCNLLKCHFMLQALTLPFPINLIHPALSRHDRGAWARSARHSGGIPKQALPIIDLAVAVCDTYR